jgi:hypothetical protein
MNKLCLPGIVLLIACKLSVHMKKTYHIEDYHKSKILEQIVPYRTLPLSW